VTLMAAAAVVGLTARGVYRDPDGIVALLRGYDLVALVIAVPLLVAALLRRTVRGELVWAGLLVYAGYNYAYYLLGTRLNALFVLHALVVGLALVGLVLSPRSQRHLIWRYWCRATCWRACCCGAGARGATCRQQRCWWPACCTRSRT
jgi:hypothetical protein